MIILSYELIKCAYCGNEKKPSEMHRDLIFYKNNKHDNNAPIQHAIGWYCNDSNCKEKHQYEFSKR